MQAVVERNPADLEKFYAANSRPVVNLYEQCYFLAALRSLEALANAAGDVETGKFTREKFAWIAGVVSTRHWDEADGFYYDWDVTANPWVNACPDPR